MKIALAAPQSRRPNVVLSNVPDYSLSPPLGLLYLAAGVADEHDVEIFDAQLQQEPVPALAKRILAADPDLVGVTMNFSTVIDGAVKLACLLKRERPDLLLVAGGNSATFMGSELCKEGSFDAVFLREADESFPSFVRHLEHGDPWSTSGIVFNHNGQVCQNPSRGYVRDLDKIPIPRYDLLPKRERYLPTIVSSRGCSFACIYCSTKSMWGRWRFRTPASVVREVDAMYELGFRKKLAFCDDEFVVRRHRAIEIAKLIEVRGYGYRWGFAGRIECIDRGILEAVSRAGCEQIFFGIESGSDRVRKLLRRKGTARKVKSTVNLCIEYGIIPIVSFMVGIPYETMEDALETLDLMRHINTYRVQLSVFTPLLGTPVFQNPQEYGLALLPDAFETDRVNIDVGTVVHSTNNLSSSEIRELWMEGQGIVMQRYREKAEYEEDAARIRA